MPRLLQKYELGKQNAHTSLLASAQPSLDVEVLCVLWIATTYF